jgi:hypothetical protein
MAKSALPIGARSCRCPKDSESLCLDIPKRPTQGYGAFKFEVGKGI